MTIRWREGSKRARRRKSARSWHNGQYEQKSKFWAKTACFGPKWLISLVQKNFNSGSAVRPHQVLSNGVCVKRCFPTSNFFEVFVKLAIIRGVKSEEGQIRRISVFIRRSVSVFIRRSVSTRTNLLSITKLLGYYLCGCI